MSAIRKGEVGGQHQNTDLTVKRYDNRYCEEVLSLANETYKTSHGFNLLDEKTTFESKIDEDCFFLGFIDGAVVSAVRGHVEKDTGKGIVSWACSHPSYWGKGYTLQPMVSCLSCLYSKGVGEVTVNWWVDGPYRNLINDLEAQGFHVFHKSVNIRRDLGEPLPVELIMPRPYTLRTFRKGDDETWAKVLSKVFNMSVKPEDFWKQSFLGVHMDSDFDPEGFLFVDRDGETVGMSAGIVCNQQIKSTGFRVGALGWTGVDAEHRGSGLGYALLAAALRYLKSKGMDVCEGGTQFYRTAAINLYEKVGFKIYTSWIAIGGKGGEIYLHKNARFVNGGTALKSDNVVKLLDHIGPDTAQRMAREHVKEYFESDLIETRTIGQDGSVLEKCYLRGIRTARQR